MNGIRLVLSTLLVLLFFLHDSIAESSVLPMEHHLYLKKIAGETITFDWKLVRGERLTLVTLLGSEEDTTLMSPDRKTLSWTVVDPEARTDLRVVRQDDRLIFTGRFKGEAVQRTVVIDSDPWYQALSMSLRQFNDSEKRRMEFWSIRPDTLDVHRLQVLREDDEMVEIEGELHAAVRMKIQLTGFRSVFWSCHYWLLKENGLFIRYEGPSGPPGWPVTHVELIGLGGSYR